MWGGRGLGKLDDLGGCAGEGVFVVGVEVLEGIAVDDEVGFLRRMACESELLVVGVGHCGSCVFFMSLVGRNERRGSAAEVENSMFQKEGA